MYPKIMPQMPAQNPGNPTDSQRHKMLYDSLVKTGRPQDYKNIVSFLSPPLGPTGHIPHEFKNIRVGIIGGGLAGMSAAFELRKLGFDITIFEPNTERVGGRIYTYYFDRDKRFYGELGAMRIPVSHETTWHYINLFKLNTEPFIQSAPNTFTYVRNTRVRNDLKGENVFHNIYPLFDLTTLESNIPWPALYNQVTKYYLSIIPPDIRKQFLIKMEDTTTGMNLLWV
jgi:monoamine oxidase